jgi:hypothetical protein
MGLEEVGSKDELESSYLEKGKAANIVVKYQQIALAPF